MPQYRNPFEKGDLFIKFDVQFPDNNWISPEKLVVRQVPSLNTMFVLGASRVSSKVETISKAIHKKLYFFFYFTAA